MRLMQQVYIPKERVDELKKRKEFVERVEKECSCSVKFGVGNYLDLVGDAYGEYTAKNILFAFGRGFDERTALRLLEDKYYLSTIDLMQIFKNKNRMHEIKARIIGVNGKTKRYIETVSSAHLSIYGGTVCIIGDMKAVHEAEAAIKTLINGGSHRKAYERLEAQHRSDKSL